MVRTCLFEPYPFCYKFNMLEIKEVTQFPIFAKLFFKLIDLSFDALDIPDIKR